MNKRDLAKAVAVQADVPLSTVTSVLDGFTDVVTAVVAKGEPVVVSGFAKFVKVERAARMGRNPATGEQIRIKASKKARITPVKAFKDAVMAPAGAPRLVRGAWPTSAEAVKSAGRTAAPAAVRAPAGATRSPAAKKAARSPAAKKAATRAPAKKAASTRAGAKKAPVRKAPAKRTATRKAPARTPAKRSTGRR